MVIDQIQEPEMTSGKLFLHVLDWEFITLTSRLSHKSSTIEPPPPLSSMRGIGSRHSFTHKPRIIDNNILAV